MYVGTFISVQPVWYVHVPWSVQCVWYMHVPNGHIQSVLKELHSQGVLFQGSHQGISNDAMHHARPSWPSQKMPYTDAMHSPACLSTKSPILADLTQPNQDYMILLLPFSLLERKVNNYICGITQVVFFLKFWPHSRQYLFPGIQHILYMSPVSPIFHIVSTVNS